jgi:hypothetical protein
MISNMDPADKAEVKPGAREWGPCCLSFNFLCCVLFFVTVRPLSCVSDVANVCGLSIRDCGFLSSLFKLSRGNIGLLLVNISVFLMDLIMEH